MANEIHKCLKMVKLAYDKKGKRLMDRCEHLKLIWPCFVLNSNPLTIPDRNCMKTTRGETTSLIQ